MLGIYRGKYWEYMANILGKYWEYLKNRGRIFEEHRGNI